MDYTLDEQEHDVSQLAALIVGNIATPDRLAQLDADGGVFLEELWTELARAGLVGIAVPEDLGGSGAGFRELCLVIEHVAAAAAPVFLVETTVAAILPLLEFGTPEQKERLVAPFAAGDLIVTGAVETVPGAPTSLHARRGPQGWVVDGALSHVPLADRATRVLTVARDEDDRRGLFLIDPSAAELSRQTSADRRGRHQIRLAGYVVPEHDVVAVPGTLSDADVRRMTDLVVIARCIEALGTAEAALQMTATYVSQREQFGRPIGTFQAVAHKVADAYIDAQGIRLTAWRAAWLLAEGRDDPEATAIAGYWAAAASTRVLETAMQLHGGVSVDLDFPLHRYYLAARQETLALGGPDRRLGELAHLMAGA